ncbi:hypothetical protein Pmani_003387 [Petrolisthes manimaculis]|uniref:Uncharacterized protein n=1 Tax=Petrolisthes manimaculis TaxID=1843537 RepID=A0AAE1Q9P9_9EUCA|nr:hypothetical protein Pmani_006749 [Petrolisthes manimaculis]KAK4322430.1 hypothetical protein Pmani_006770 [Petrolisthes manimaculis]KAK4326056.1 hypothetical protein Pmani_003387 [Petrolisthes manimaculis]
MNPWFSQLVLPETVLKAWKEASGGYVEEVEGMVRTLRHRTAVMVEDNTKTSSVHHHSSHEATYTNTHLILGSTICPLCKVNK